MSDKIGDFPEQDPRGVAFHVAQTAVGAADIAIPGAGYALQQIVGHFVGEPLQKRRDEWFRQLGARLLELQNRFEGFDPSNLEGNEAFVSVVYEATHVAMKSHKEFKREALANAVLNVAIGQTIDEALQGRFMACIESFSAAHIRLLSVLAAPSAYEKCVAMANRMSMGSQSVIIRAEISTDEISEPLFGVVVADLIREGFIDGGMNVMTTNNAFLSRRTTATGDSFLAFIRSPPG
ncbi:hypothetical protein AMC78_CH02622 [Rhizobium phaseoli]|uniref:hypothetical protein n=1 Tax=Rhizobium phaseoli TaxID=396 RepID=UPI0007F0863C|nr:hypothetical protein [Rhizobium phaseoli]ANM04708.1 hypothetical protein AMC78_CH02622 [Rhizobium phaseoli]